jgi:hypothetical protein
VRAHVVYLIGEAMQDRLDVGAPLSGSGRFGSAEQHLAIAVARAFALLRRYSQDHNIKLTEVATSLISNRDLPSPLRDADGRIRRRRIWPGTRRADAWLVRWVRSVGGAGERGWREGSFNDGVGDISEL